MLPLSWQVEVEEPRPDEVLRVPHQLWRFGMPARSASCQSAGLVMGKKVVKRIGRPNCPRPLSDSPPVPGTPRTTRNVAGIPSSKLALTRALEGHRVGANRCCYPVPWAPRMDKIMSFFTVTLNSLEERSFVLKSY